MLDDPFNELILRKMCYSLEAQNEVPGVSAIVPQVSAIVPPFSAIVFSGPGPQNPEKQQNIT